MNADEPFVLDAPLLQSRGFSLTLESLESCGVSLSGKESERGWLRRYAPSDWRTGIVSGSQEAAIHRTFLSLVGSISRLGNRSWLTRVDEMLRAEDRLHQLAVAATLQISIPRTIIASCSKTVVNELGNQFIVKPLSNGVFTRDGKTRSVFANVLDSATAKGLDFGAVPFVAQELIAADRHLRAVTVRGESWVAELSAEGRPLDWRQQESAHSEWEQTEDQKVAEQSTLLAKNMGIGYSSQDWLVRGSERIFIDLNPGGQWMFLPVDISECISSAIGRYLVEST